MTERSLPDNLWLVTATGGEPIRVTAPNWLSALGKGLQEMGAADSLARLACERLANGRVLANDMSGQRYVVERIEDEVG